jgi:ppGpp synthetase/RelA/SpoT-type nucleotidyltranferase
MSNKIEKSFSIETLEIWKNSPDLVMNFINLSPEYEQLCIEVSYILKKRLTEEAIEISNITMRAKKLDSFILKIQRKEYDDPFTDITDFAGVRVVCLYRDDIKKIAEIIDREFKIIETVDKYGEMGTDRFGYGAVHYIVKLGRKSSGARYDDLKEKICEIQVRTVLQDAWAIIEHHLMYKQESDVPKVLQRKLNSLAGLFETADDQFFRIKQDRKAYIENVRSELDSPSEFLLNDLNFDTFEEYLKWKYPDLPIAFKKSHIETIFFDINKYKYKYKLLNDLNEDVDKSSYCLQKTIGILNRGDNPGKGHLCASAQLIISLGITDDEILEHENMPERWKNAIKECKNEDL